MKCLFCNNLIPKYRIHKNWTKYCSVICNKRSWYLKHNPNVKSYFANNPAFWKTETGIGFKWEKFGAKLLSAKHLGFGHKADLDWNGKLVDVKCSNLYYRKLKRGKLIKSKQQGWWVFNRNKDKPIDFFLCIALLNNKPYKVFLIPNNQFPKIGATIGWKSRYNKFLLA